MKRIIYFLAILSVLMFACTITTPPTPVVTNPPAITVTPTVTPPPAVQANVTCNELSLYLDPALASGHDCKTIPETAPDSPPFDAAPQHTELTLLGYPLADRFFPPHISIYPVQRFSEIVPDTIPQRVTDLQALIGGGTPGDKGLPFLPVFNAAEEFYAQYSLVAFQSGNGIRFLTQFSQFADPINNHEMFYTFQGLTGDGKYWVSAILPISNAILPENGDNLPNGQSWDQYMSDLKTQLNSQGPDAFTPGITALDNLIKSIQIQP
jgi:hypothetical protein